MCHLWPEYGPLFVTVSHTVAVYGQIVCGGGFCRLVEKDIEIIICCALSSAAIWGKAVDMVTCSMPFRVRAPFAEELTTTATTTPSNTLVRTATLVIFEVLVVVVFLREGFV
jgi:hypothetical protein